MPAKWVHQGHCANRCIGAQLSAAAVLEEIHRPGRCSHFCFVGPAATFPKLFIHGRHDLVAPTAYAHSLAERLGAPFVELPGAHFVTRESSRQVSHQPAVREVSAGGACITQMLDQCSFLSWLQDAAAVNISLIAGASKSMLPLTCAACMQVNALLAGMVFTESLAARGSAASSALIPSKESGSLHSSSSMGSICALHPHEEHLIVRPITPTPLQYRKDAGSS